ncbi:2TM domain-containing protein [Polaribacter batillariae]|uniref:2TM domain-containing protein n=1 Tax=Polaribacter batillariae TaxID=2808900 RepID=A0ABX7SYD6_9FLAO|nr:2TM domain-containing protein [Polaribacter batillariae]QTD37814.1 2TM domain-containing protein [Polaribacter batillariae]
MKPNFWEEQQYIKAKKRVKDIKAFYTHLAVYCVIIPTIIFVNLTFEPHFHWFWFSLIGWGLGLFCHWFNVFGIRFLGLEKNWEERKIKEFMNEKND